MQIEVLTIIVASLMTMATVARGADIERLELVRSIPLSGASGLEPSGLTSCMGELLTISDKHDMTLYRIQLDGVSANLEEARHLTHIPEPPSPPLPWHQKIQRWFSSLLYSKYDWEGVACDSNNDIYLLSESNVAVLRVTPSGKSEWLDMPLYAAARQAGLLQRFNAFVEGIALSHGSMIIAAERDPRGLMSASVHDGQWTIDHAERSVDSGLPAPTSDQRSSDFADLYADDRHLYMLERNHSAICRRNLDSFALEYCWSYAHVENAPELRYKDSRYGVAEGMTIHQGSLYVIVDNNRGARMQAPDDTQPVLFQFIIPKNWASEQ